MYVVNRLIVPAERTLCRMTGRAGPGTGLVVGTSDVMVGGAGTSVTGPAAARAVQSVPLSEGCLRWSPPSQPSSLGICALKPVGMEEEGAHWVTAA